MAKPKLALIPAAQGSKLFSVLPSSGVGDFDFTRSGSATRINSQGLIETVGNGVSRLNYPMIDGKVVGCPHHILEPQRTNLITYSEDFSQWTNIRSSDSMGFTSPDGTNNATLLISESDSASNNKYIQSDLFNISNGAKISGSIFLKANQLNWARVVLVNSSLSKSMDVFFNLESGVVGTSSTTGSSTISSTSIEDYGNGWFRCNIVGDLDTSTNCRMRCYLADGDNDSSVYGDGTSGIYIWGAQVEQGSYPTSYIKTNGSTVTRSAETANSSGDASTFNDSEGVLMAEVKAFNGIGSFENLSLSNGTNISRVFFFYRNALNLMEFRVTVNNSMQMQFQYTIDDATLFNKLLIKYKENDFSVWINGFELHTDNNGITFNEYPLSNLSFDNGQVSAPGSPFYGSTKQIQYFDSTLTDIELEQLTSWTSFTDMAQGQLYTIE